MCTFCWTPIYNLLFEVLVTVGMTDTRVLVDSPIVNMTLIHIIHIGYTYLVGQ